MRRGEVWWVSLPLPVGHRPVVLLSRDRAYTARQFVTVAPVSTRVRNIRSEVLLSLEDGMPRPCAVNLDNIMTVSKGDIREQVALLRPSKMREVEAAIRFALGIAE